MKHDIFSQYLHITAIAVKLHFPNIAEEVSTQELIEVVQSSPFHLYYDLMMHYMRTEKTRKISSSEQERSTRMENKIPKKETNSVHSEKLSWIYRIFKRINSTPPSKAFTINTETSKENNQELGISRSLTSNFGGKSTLRNVTENNPKSDNENKESRSEDQNANIFVPAVEPRASGYSFVV